MDDHFTPWSERRLADSSDEQLVVHVRDAQRHGHAGAAGDAYEHLCARHDHRVRKMLGAKLPANEVEDLAQDVFVAAFEGVFGEREIGNFRAWLNQVVRNTVADVWRGREALRIEAAREAAQRDPGIPEPEPAVEGGYGEWDAREVVEQVLGRLSGVHRLIAEEFVLGDADAATVARLASTSADNVYQVARRFRIELQRQLEGDPHDNED